jgi:arylformamidase
MEIFDVSVPIRNGMIVYEGDPEVRLERVVSIAAGAHVNISRVDLGVHSGTHVDAPLHFIDAGAGVETLPLDALVGPAHVVDATAVERALDGPALRRLALPDGAERLLFKTTNSQLWELDRFADEFVSFREDGARALIERGVRLVGIDYLSVGDEGAHVALLGAGVVPLEGLDLRHIEPGPYTLICLPLKLVGSDGAPARTLLVRD